MTHIEEPLLYWPTLGCSQLAVVNGIVTYLIISATRFSVHKTVKAAHRSGSNVEHKLCPREILGRNAGRAEQGHALSELEIVRSVAHVGTTFSLRGGRRRPGTQHGRDYLCVQFRLTNSDSLLDTRYEYWWEAPRLMADQCTARGWVPCSANGLEWCGMRCPDGMDSSGTTFSQPLHLWPD